MNRTLRNTLVCGAVLAASMWTLAAFGAWWLLQAAAGALDGGSTASVMQAFNVWTDRTWVRHWLDPQDIDALRDGLDWLLSLGGGPAAWLGTALTLLTVALVVFWAGGLVLAALGVLAVVVATRRIAAWQRQGAPWSKPTPAPVPGDVSAVP